FAPFLLRLRELWSKSLKVGVILSPSVDAVDAKFSICNLQSISQAGRRRFESGLPLHKINNLQGIQKQRPPSKPPSICAKACVLTLHVQAKSQKYRQRLAHVGVARFRSPCRSRFPDENSAVYRIVVRRGSQA